MRKKNYQYSYWGMIVTLFITPLSLFASTTPEFIYGQNHQVINPSELKMNPDTPEASHNASGAFAYSIPIVIPPGRNQIQPNLSLNYNSQSLDPQSWLGAGWEISIPVIERLNKNGIDNMYSQTYFTSTADGELSPVALTDTVHGTYKAKVNTGQFLKYELTTNDVWIVTDTSGKTYEFGTDTNSRIDNPNDASQINTWYLTKIEDTNNNSVTYTYTKDLNQVYPLSISYTDNPNASAIFTIDFTLGSRDDQLTRYDTGFKVQTYYIIDNIIASANGQWVRKYDFSYSKPNNRERYLLSSIQETGRSAEGIETTLPATTFTYQDTVGGWTLSSSYTFPLSFTSQYNGIPSDDGVRLFDVNGDGLTDMVYATENAGFQTVNAAVCINTGSNFIQDTTYVVPVGFLSYNPGQRGVDLGVRIADVNGDGLQDLIKSYDGTDSGNFVASGVYLNDPSNKTWTLESSFRFPSGFVSNSGSIPQDSCLRLVDVNGDHLPDLIHSIASNSGVYTGAGSVLINNGSTWTQDTAYNMPIPIGNQITGGCFDVGVAFDDVNGDGLVDLLKGYQGTYAVYLNQGLDKTWTSGLGYNFSSEILSYSGSVPYDSGLRFLDVNGDHLSDLVSSTTGSTGIYSNTYSVQIAGNDTTGWTSARSADFPVPVGFVQQGSGGGITNIDEGVRYGDIDGDGLVDIIKNGYGETDNGVYLNAAEPADLLTGITLSSGASITINYAPANHTDNPDLPYVVQTVSSIERHDGLGNTSTIDYTYSGGEHFFDSIYNQKFAGFSKITETTDDRIVDFYYHQGNDSNTPLGEYDDSGYKIGQIYREDVSDLSGNLYSSEVTKWEETDGFVYPTQKTNLLYNGSSSHVDSSSKFDYDTTNGNLLEQVQYGEVTASSDGTFTDTGTDLVQNTFTYATDANAIITNAVNSKSSYDINNTLLKETLTSYDNQPYGQVTVGNKTNTQEWISGSDYKNTDYTYNAVGLIETTTDSNANTTTISFDSNLLYPDTVTNALSQKSSYAYDLGTGQKTETTDANGFVTQMTYDGLGRTLTKLVSDPLAPATLVTVESHTYDDTSLPLTETGTNYLSATDSTENYIYKDGFNRIIQTRMSTETANVFNVVDYEFNSTGSLGKQSLPYFDNGSSFSGITTNSDYLVAINYDSLRRRSSVSTILGTNQFSYTDRTLTWTDTLNHQRQYIYNAFDQLTQVIEDIGGIAATTNYTLDALNRVNTITDANNIISSMSYDGLNRLLTQTLPHNASASTTNSWIYQYDAVGNRTQTTTPQGDVVLTNYDALNRPTLIDAVNDITYKYDTCTYGIGRLCSADVANSVNIEYTYDTHGNVSTEKRTIDSTDYTTSYRYTWMNQLDSLTYPDATSLNYSWNSGGKVETATYTSISGIASTIISNVDYGPSDKVTSISYLNGVTTTYNYDSAFLYAPTSLTSSVSGSDLITLNYNFDTVLNMTSRTLVSGSMDDIATTFSYDNLDRLTSTDMTIEGSNVATNLSYTYDANGNMTYASDLGSYTYDTDHPQAISTVGTKNYSYDAAGNVMAMNAWIYTWNDFQQMTSATAGSNQNSFYYDHTGERIKKYNHATGKYLLTVNPYYDVNPMHNTKHIAIPGLGNVAEAAFNRNTNINTFMYHLLDYQGSHLMSVNQRGRVTNALDYYPFGTQRTNVKTGFSNKYTFTGKLLDLETGLLYLGKRYYSPTIARLLSQDPWGGDYSRPQTINKYSYGLNNPLRYNDPSGALVNDTLVQGCKQIGGSVGQIGMMIFDAFTGGMQAGALIATGHPLLATSSLTTTLGGSLANYDDSMVSLTNGFNNIVNAFQNQQTETLITQGPYRDFADHFPGMNEYLTGSQQASNFTSILDIPKSLGQAAIRQTQLINGAINATNGKDIPQSVSEAVGGAIGTAIANHIQSSQPTSYPIYNTTLSSAPEQSSWLTNAHNFVNATKNE